ncbi:hypothetical protein Emed_000528 [Eimeria media]
MGDSLFCGPAKSGDNLTPLTSDIRNIRKQTSFARQIRMTTDALGPAQQAQQVRETSSSHGDELKPTTKAQEGRYPPATASSQDASSPLHAADPGLPEKARAPHQPGGSSERREEEERNVALEEEVLGCYLRRVIDKGGNLHAEIYKAQTAPTTLALAMRLPQPVHGPI